MSIRHVGIFVKNFEDTKDILLGLGFEIVQNTIESILGFYRFISKLSNGQCVIEIIEGPDIVNQLDIFHLSFNGEVPESLKKYEVVSFEPADKNLLVDFVYIGDSIYFEFVRNKNDI